MKGLLKKAKIIMLAALITVTAAVPAFADDEAVVKVDEIANQFGAGQTVGLNGNMLDGLAAGYNVSLNNSKVDGTSALAGYNVDMRNSEVGGSLFVAGYNVSVIDSAITNNIIATGYNVTLNDGTSAKKLTAAASTVTVNGVLDYADIDAETVIINGTINNNATIHAQDVQFGENAKVLGNLTVESVSEPDSAKGVTAGEYTFDQIEVESNTDEVSVEVSDSVVSIILGYLLSRLYWIVAMLIVGLIFLFCFYGEIRGIGNTTVKKPGITIGLGFAALAGVPVASVLLAITFVGLPASVILLTLYIITICMSQTLVGFALGRIFIGRFIKIEKLASILGVIVLIFVDTVPYLGAISSLACVILTFGYIVLRIAGYAVLKDEEPVAVEISEA